MMMTKMKKKLEWNHLILIFEKISSVCMYNFPLPFRLNPTSAINLLHPKEQFEIQYVQNAQQHHRLIFKDIPVKKRSFRVSIAILPGPLAVFFWAIRTRDSKKEIEY